MRTQVLKTIVSRNEMLTAADIFNPNISGTPRVSRRSSGSTLAIRRTGQPRKRGLDNLQEQKYYLCRQRPGRLWGPFELYQLFLFVGKSGRSVNQTTHL